MKNKKTVLYSILIVILLLLSFFGVKEYLTDEVTQTESVVVTPEVTPAQIETVQPNYENEPPLILDDANDAQVESNEPVAGHSQPRLEVDKQSDEHLSAEQTDSQLVPSPPEAKVNATPLEQTKKTQIQITVSAYPLLIIIQNRQYQPLPRARQLNIR